MGKLAVMEGQTPFEQPDNKVLGELLYVDIPTREHRIITEYMPIPTGSALPEVRHLAIDFENQRRDYHEKMLKGEKRTAWYPNNEIGVLYEFALHAWAEAVANPRSGIDSVRLCDTDTIDYPAIRVIFNDDFKLGRVSCPTMNNRALDELENCFVGSFGVMEWNEGNVNGRFYEIAGGWMRVETEESKVTSIRLFKNLPAGDRHCY